MPLSIFAQQQRYVFQHLTTKDGLASNTVKSIFQDSRGFYWLGTESGLQKFDGKHFSDILPGKTNNNGRITSGTVLGLILEDKQQNIWIQTANLIAVYHRLTGKVDSIEINDDTENAGVGGIKGFCRDEQGNMWITTRLNIYKYDYTRNKCMLWRAITRGNKYNAAYLLYDSLKKSLWLARDRDILLIDIKTKNIKRPFVEKVDDASIPEGHFISTFWRDSKQNFWFSDFNGILYKYNILTYKKKAFSEFYSSDEKKLIKRKPEALSFIEDKNGTLWIGSLNNGLLYYDEEQDLIQSVPVNKDISTTLSYDYYINCLSGDKEGNIWAGTDKGISIFNPSLQQFTTIDENSPVDPFPKSEVTQIFETSSGNILAGTWGKGWFIYDKDFRLKIHFYDNRNLHNKRNLVWSFCEDHRGKIWVGYQHGLISVFDTATKINQYNYVPEFERQSVMTINCDVDGNVWFGLHSGALCKWDVKTGKVSVYKNLLRSLNEHVSPIRDMLIDKQGKIWVATIGDGFYCFDPVKAIVTERYTTGKPDSRIDDEVTSFTPINDTVMAIGTVYKGFLWFDRKRNTFSTFTMENGLPVNFVYGLAQDKQKNLWIATTNGLLRRGAVDKKLISFDEDDGILNNNFSSNIATLHDGRMVIATSTGLIYFSPEKISRLSVPPDVQLTSFAIFDKPLLVDSLLSNNKVVRLNHTQNFISFGYASTSFLGRNTTHYYYQLEGVDKNWVNAGIQRSVSYTNLNSGYYTFRIKCENRDGILSKEVTTLDIYIQPPWWFTWWAYCLYALFTGGTIYILHKNRINQLKRIQTTQIKAMVATQEGERKRISRDLHDEIGTKLSALKLFLSFLGEKATGINNKEIKTLTESSEQFITEAMQDVRRLLLNLSPAVLEEFGYSTAVEGLINRINQTKQIHFKLVIFGMKHRLQKDYELALYRITQELINNVLKHADAKNVALQIGSRDKKIILMIEDDGKGFDVAAHKDGYGLQNLAARTKLMQGVMTIDSQPGKGTSVWIEIPDNFNDV